MGDGRAAVGRATVDAALLTALGVLSAVRRVEWQAESDFETALRASRRRPPWWRPRSGSMRRRSPGDVVAEALRRHGLPHRVTARAGPSCCARLHRGPADVAERRGLLPGRSRRRLRPGDGGGGGGAAEGQRSARDGNGGQGHRSHAAGGSSSQGRRGSATGPRLHRGRSTDAQACGVLGRAVDGTWTPALTDALKAFQTKLGVKPTGTVDAATITALNESIATSRTALTSTSTSAPAGSSTSTGPAPAPSTASSTAG